VNERPSQFWTFSLTVYGEPAVQQECLELQDRHGVDVNLLLFCAFVGAVHGAVLSEEEVRQLAGAVTDWQQNVVRSLRQARRALKPLATDASPIAAPAAALRATVKAMELEAERIEQMILDCWRAARLGVWPRAEPVAAVAGNIRALFAIGAEAMPPPELPMHLLAAALAAAGQVRA